MFDFLPLKEFDPMMEERQHLNNNIEVINLADDSEDEEEENNGKPQKENRSPLQNSKNAFFQLMSHSKSASSPASPTKNSNKSNLNKNNNNKRKLETQADSNNNNNNTSPKKEGSRFVQCEKCLKSVPIL